MAKDITKEQIADAVYIIKKYEYQQMKTGKPLLALLNDAGATILLRERMRFILDHCITTQLFPFSSVHHISDAYFCSYFTPDDLNYEDIMYKRTVRELTNILIWAGNQFGKFIESPIDPVYIFNRSLSRWSGSNNSAYIFEAGHSLDTALDEELLTRLQYDHAVEVYEQYERQRMQGGQSLLKLLRTSGISSKIVQMVYFVLNNFISHMRIPFTHPDDVSDIYFAANFTVENFSKIRGVGKGTLLKLATVLNKMGVEFIIENPPVINKNEEMVKLIARAIKIEQKITEVNKQMVQLKQDYENLKNTQ